MELDIQSRAEISGSEKRAPHDVHGCSSLSVRHTHRAGKKKNTISVSTNSNVSFCGTYGCSNLSLSSHRWVLGKWMSKNLNFKSNDDDDDEDDDDDADDETLRRGCCVKRRTRYVTRVHLGGVMELDIQSRAEISGSEKRAPHDVHGCSSLSVRHTHRAGKKKNTISVSTNSNVSFCGTYGCSNLSLSSHR